MIGLLFFHGWGFDRHVWVDVESRLDKSRFRSHCYDEGYFGDADTRPNLDPHIPWFGIGHSLGFSKLLRWYSGAADSVPFAGIIGFGAFTWFCKSESRPIGTPKRLVQRMLTAFEHDPENVLREFYSNAGLESSHLRKPPPRGRDDARLHQDLESLLTLDIHEDFRNLPIPVRCIAGQNDRIVSPQLAGACFGGFQNVHLSNLADGQHSLPLLNPDLCWNEIQTFTQKHLAA